MPKFLFLTQNPTSEDYAKAMSAELWRLTHVPQPGDVTHYAVPWVKDHVTGEYALYLDGDERLRPDADIDRFVALLPATVGEKAALALTMRANRGKRLRYEDMIPPSMWAKTRDTINGPPDP